MKQKIRPVTVFPGSTFFVWALGLSLGACVGCGSDEPHEGGDHEEESEGTPTGSTCPTDSTLTYDSFGQEFMESYCTRCHSSALEGVARNGAPDDHNFDTIGGIRATEPEHLDGQAAAGPDATNELMPPDGMALPSAAARRDLGEWIACGLP